MSTPFTILYKNLDLRGLPVHIARTRFAPEERIREHDHDFYEFFLLHRGSMIHHVNGGQEELGAGSLVLLKPDDRHWFKNTDRDGDLLILNVAFDKILLEDTVRFMFGTDGNVLRTGQRAALPTETATGLVRRTGMIERAFSDGEGALAQARLLVGEVVSLIHAADEHHARQPAWLEAACRQMREPEEYRAGLGRFVHLAGKSQEHLTRVMKKVLGITPTMYINRIKCAEAARLLGETDLQILDIVFEAGFVNVSHFINSFKKVYGMTPRQYRQENRRVFKPEISD